MNTRPTITRGTSSAAPDAIGMVDRILAATTSEWAAAAPRQAGCADGSLAAAADLVEGRCEMPLHEGSRGPGRLTASAGSSGDRAADF
jgi:hypothetical protein